MKKEGLPSKLLKTNFLVKLPSLEDNINNNEDELSAPKPEDTRLKIVQVSSQCSLKIGDEVMISMKYEPVMIIKSDEDQYAMFAEGSVEAIY